MGWKQSSSFVATRADSEGQVGRKTDGGSGIALMVTAKSGSLSGNHQRRGDERITEITMGDQ